MEMENFLMTKSRRNFLERLKQKIDIFINKKKIFNPIINTILSFISLLYPLSSQIVYGVATSLIIL